jgi:hypothetical protein
VNSNNVVRRTSIGFTSTRDDIPGKMAITKKHLSQLKNTTDSIDPYDKVASLVQKTIYPDLDTEPLYLILGNILNKSNA